MLNDGIGFKKVYLATGRTDMRHNIDGLARIIRFQFELDPYAKISKTSVMKKAEIQRTQFNHYYRNKTNHIDIDVPARLYFVLNCSVEDILEFIFLKCKHKLIFQ